MGERHRHLHLSGNIAFMLSSLYTVNNDFRSISNLSLENFHSISRTRDVSKKWNTNFTAIIAFCILSFERISNYLWHSWGCGKMSYCCKKKCTTLSIVTNKNLTHSFYFLCSVEKLRSAVAIVEPQTPLAMPGDASLNAPYLCTCACMRIRI